MFSRILIANRGEIACRIIRTARRLGITAAVVYSDADRSALHVAQADEAYYIGPAEARHSYLVAERIVEAAAVAAADAIHPGYGLLSENAAFAEACAEAGFVFIGPPADAIRAMGSKSEAKQIMAAAGVPVVPGYHGPSRDDAALARAAVEIGYPLLVKAVSGGGGRGMRIVEEPRELLSAIESARREAASAFHDDALLLERYLPRARHVEVQVFADGHGGAVHLFERDCSIQRRHQKIVEEAPAPGLSEGLRRRLGEAAVTAARAIGYKGAGTIEFLLDGDDFWFMEMNTRLQVEHPVTEMITGLDLVEWQLRIAAGEPLPLVQDDIAANGHAFEARIYAEDPARDFLPAAGRLSHLRFPPESPHVRIDSGVVAGDEVGIHYDPLIAKLIVWDSDRARALARFRRALEQVQVVGPATNVAFLQAVAGHPRFASGEVDTRFIERHKHDLFVAGAPAEPRTLALAALYVLLRRDEEARQQAAASADPFSPWHRTDGWRLNKDTHHVLAFGDGDRRVEVVVHYRSGGLLLELPGAPAPVASAGEIDEAGDLVAEFGGVRMKATVVRRGDEITVMAGGASHRLVLDDPAARAQLTEAYAGSLKAPMPGRIAAVTARAGERVSRGATLMVLEAMKMEHAITAPADGTIARIHYAPGEQVDEGAVLVSFEEEESSAGAPEADTDEPAPAAAS
jgi:3-methylcrotonyl-CoA carboxylase alpha subunit